MIKWSSRAVLLLSGSAIVLAGSVLPAQAATAKGWRVAATVVARGRVSLLSSVDAVSAGDAWATGFTATSKFTHISGTIRHWNGKSWRLVKLPAKVAAAWAKDTPVLATVAASSTKNVWAFSSFVAGAHYLRLAGSHWSTGKMPGSTSTALLQITAAKAFSSKNVWVFGDRFSLKHDTSSPYAAHFDGSKWSATTVTGSEGIDAVSATSANSLWAVLDSDSAQTAPTVAHWTRAAGWQLAVVQPVLPAGADLTSIVAEPNGAVWIGGASGTTLRPFAAELAPGGSSWTVATLPAGTGGVNWQISGLASDGRGGLWALSTNEQVKGQPQRLLHLQGAAWSLVKPAFGKREWLLEQIAAVPHTASLWGVGVQKVGSGGNGLIALDGPTPR